MNLPKLAIATVALFIASSLPASIRTPAPFADVVGLIEVIDQLEAILETAPGTVPQDPRVAALENLSAAFQARIDSPPAYAASLSSLQEASANLEAAVEAAELDPAEGAGLMAAIARVTRRFAVAATAGAVGATLQLIESPETPASIAARERKALIKRLRAVERYIAHDNLPAALKRLTREPLAASGGDIAERLDTVIRAMRAIAEGDAQRKLRAFTSAISHDAEGFDLAGGLLGEVTCGLSAATIIGTAGDDELIGTPEADVIAGLGGNDTIYGGQGNDVLCGGAGQDFIDGEEGSDVLYGDGDNDVMQGGDGDDALYGGAGIDSIFGTGGSDFLSGDDARDHMQGGTGVDALYGGDGDDFLGGGDGDDNLHGQVGDDTLHGGSGDDVISGEEGNDILSGGPGSDQCDGGDGTDAGGAGCEDIVSIP